MFKVLITGAKGQVGSEIVKAAPIECTVIGLGSDQLDVTNESQIKEVLAQHQPDLIINAAVYTAVDKAESEAEKAFAVNERAVEFLAQAAKEADIPLFHISTDYVFDGKAQSPYKETDTVNPTSIYGLSKLAGEQAIARVHEKHIILRTSWVFGAIGNNFVKTMLRLARERDELSIVADQQGCPTSSTSIAEVLWQFIALYCENRTLSWGIYHFSNYPVCSWHGFALEILTAAQAQGFITHVPKINEISTEEYPTPAIRPLWSVLDNSKIEAVLDKKYSWQDELNELLLNMKDA